jgi:hypothetical protein
MTALYAHGNRLLLDGKPFFPKGFNSVAGTRALPMCGGRSARAAFEQFTADGSPTSTALRRDWHANIIRLQVVQSALADAAAAPAYVRQLQQLVSIAEAAGLCVILCMQDTLPPPCGSSLPTNAVINDKTATAWTVLAPVFALDQAVVYELYNEISLETTQWSEWKVQNQRLVDLIRSKAQNLILAGGCHKNMTFHGLGTHGLLRGLNIGYAIHPYNYGHKGWHDLWAYLTPVVPVIATEWYNTDVALAKSLVPTFLAFLKSRNVGLLAWAFDSPTSCELVTHTVDPTDTTKPWIWTPAPPSGQTLMDWFAT